MAARKKTVAEIPEVKEEKTATKEPVKKTTTRKKSTTTKSKTVEKTEEIKSEDNKSTEVKTTKTKKSTKSTGVPISGGDKRCYIYFDAKFTSNALDADFLSIALVDYTGNTIYVEFDDFNVEKIDRENNMKYVEGLMCPENNIIRDHFYLIRGNKSIIVMELLKWIEAVSKDCLAVQFVGDNNPYAYVRLMNLLFENTKIPETISSIYYDINQDIATSISRPNRSKKSDEEFNMNYIPVLVASEVDRYEFIRSFDPTFEYVNSKDTAVFTALTTMIIHQYLWGFH